MSDYLGMVRRHWWLVVLLTVLGTAGAAAAAGTQPKVYEATTSVLVMPLLSQEANASGGRTSNSINLDTEAQLVVSTDIATAAAKLLKVATPPDDLARDVTVTVPPNTTVLAIAFEAATPQRAQAGSHAFATAYLVSRQASARADLTAQVTALQAKIKQYSAALGPLSGRVARLDRADPNRAAISSQISTLTSQINTLTSRMNQLATTTVSAGRIISDAPLPGRPARPSVPLFLASGAMIGLLLGVGIAALCQRLDKRIRRACEVARRAQVPVLADLPKRVQPRFDDVFAPLGTGGRIFSRLRNEVLASLHRNGPADDGTDGSIVVVTGASRGSAASLVAANLAAALARAGSEVVLLCAHLTDGLGERSDATGITGVAPTPGLTDLLAGQVELDEALQRAPRNPWLRVMTIGGTASAAGLLHAQPLRDLLDELRAIAHYVVIEAPSTSVSADAQSIASLADAAIVTVELRRTRHAEVLDAAEQLHRIGTPLLGAVVLNRVSRPDNDGAVAELLSTVDRSSAAPDRPQTPAKPARRTPAGGPGRGSPPPAGRRPVQLRVAGLPVGPGQPLNLDAAEGDAAQRDRDDTVVMPRLNLATPGGDGTS